MRKIAFLIILLALAPIACAPPSEPKAGEKKDGKKDEKEGEGKKDETKKETEKGKDEESSKPKLSPEEAAALAKKLADPDLILANRELWAQAPHETQDKAIAKVTEKLGASFAFVSADEYRCGELKHRIATYRHEKSGLLLRLIPGGVYQMGDEGDSKKRRVGAMLIGAFEVRRGVWAKVEGAKDADDGDMPASKVSWDEAVAWLKKAGDGLRLPSFKEWEYACRAGSTGDYFWGEEDGAAYCWHDKNSGGKAHKVTEHKDKTNAFGLADASGNLFEWCDDMLSASSTIRAYCGGKYEGDLFDCRSAKRGGNVPGFKADWLGFRVAKSID